MKQRYMNANIQSGFIDCNLPVMTVLLLYAGVLLPAEEFLLYLSLKDG